MPALVLALGYLLIATSAMAESQFAGSSVSLRHAVAAQGLDRSADLTWNPYAAAILSISPTYALPAKLSVSASWSFEAEYTQRDTEPSQFNYGDPSLTLARSPWKHKASGLALDGSLTLLAGLSPGSRAKTRYGAANLGVGLSRKFAVQKGLSLRWGLSATAYGHGATHGSSGQSIYSACAGPIALDSMASNCAQELILHNGSANARNALSSNITASIKLPKTLGLRARLGGSWMNTYSADLNDPSISYSGPTGTATRYALFSDFRLSAAPHKRIGLAFGLQTGHPQLGADGTYRTPFVNRYSNLYFDLTARY
jgi:hypothetical protein